MGFNYNQVAEQCNFTALEHGISGDGVITNLAVSESSPSGMSVLVAAGNCTVAGGVFEEGSGQNVSVGAADAVNPRKDLICYDAGTANPACVAGTPAAAPTTPTIPADHILLSVVYIPAGVTSIVNADIEDGRVFVDNGLPIRAVSVNDTALDADTVITVNATGGSKTITLPTATGIQGKIYVIKKIDSSSNIVTVDGNASETIDGSLQLLIRRQYESVVIQSDNSNWIVVADRNTSDDLCLGITPTTDSGWTTPVATLGNMTDGDNSTKTTGGSTAVGSDVEIVKLDIGSIKNPFLITCVADIAGIGGNLCYVYIETSTDDVTYITESNISHGNSTTTKGVAFTPLNSVRYIRLRLVNSTFDLTSTVNIRRLSAIE